jgi:hypothetical protein
VTSSRLRFEGDGIAGADLPQSFDEARRHLIELARVNDGKPTENARALARDAKKRAALVDAVDVAREKTFALRAINKLDSAVVLEAETLGGVGDGDLGASGRAGYLEKKLMLLRLQSCGGGGEFTEVKEAAQLMAKLGERA